MIMRTMPIRTMMIYQGHNEQLVEDIVEDDFDEQGIDNDGEEVDDAGEVDDLMMMMTTILTTYLSILDGKDYVGNYDIVMGGGGGGDDSDCDRV